jgi:DNA polymerase (family 10)
MRNDQISDFFSLLSKLMDIHGENSFKAKSYASAAFAIDQLPVQLSETPSEQIASLKGIGSSTGQKITEILQKGHLQALDDLISKTPSGVIEMLQIKGIGPKKIHTIWKEMEIETLGELLYACQENRLKLFKGFGEKTQQNVIDAITFYYAHKESHLYAQVEDIAKEMGEFLSSVFTDAPILLTGKFIRQWETIDELEWVIMAPIEKIKKTLESVTEFQWKESPSTESIRYKTSVGVDIVLHSATSDNLIEQSILHASSDAFWKALLTYPVVTEGSITHEADYFEQRGLSWVPPFLRENPSIIQTTQANVREEVIQITDCKGIIHCHSNWSDGNNTIEALAKAAMAKGMEYLVISDHSKSAFYAQGLSVERIRAQHQQIDALNAQLAPFRIFKSIEADILNDGSLDYPDDVLAEFDLVIASVHSNLKMTEEKAMMRLMKAIENPYTTILGHPTGRLLLSRPGYPVNHKTLIDACAQHQVVMELNANPNRLDMDWRHIEYALQQNVLISINPDAHSIEGMDDIQYGIKVAQKAGVTKNQNLSSFPLSAFEALIARKKK